MILKNIWPSKLLAIIDFCKNFLTNVMQWYLMWCIFVQSFFKWNYMYITFILSRLQINLSHYHLNAVYRILKVIISITKGLSHISRKVSYRFFKVFFLYLEILKIFFIFTLKNSQNSTYKYYKLVNFFST